MHGRYSRDHNVWSLADRKGMLERRIGEWLHSQVGCTALRRVMFYHCAKISDHEILDKAGLCEIYRMNRNGVCHSPFSAMRANVTFLN
jgi:hypothetical protein